MGVSYNDFISAVANYYNAEAGIPPTAQWASSTTWSTVSTDMARVGITSDNYINYLENFPELFDITRNADGTVLDSSLKKYMYYGNVNRYNTNTGGALNSNTLPSTIAESTGLNISGLTDIATTGKLTVKGGIGLKTDTGLTTTGVASTIGTALLAVGVGCQLGKVIGTALYEGQPNYWDENPLKALSNEDWNKFAISVKDQIHSGLLALFGVDGDTTTMYLDENAVGYMAWYLNTLDWFKQSGTNVITTNEIDGYIKKPPISFINIPITPSLSANTLLYSAISINGDIYDFYVGNPDNSNAYFTITNKGVYVYSRNQLTSNIQIAIYKNGKVLQGLYPTQLGSHHYIFNSGDVYEGVAEYTHDKLASPLSVNQNTGSDLDDKVLGLFILYGDYTTTSNIPGVTNNPNSAQFDPTGVGSVTTALGALKNQYPDLWNNSIKRNTIQDDGSEDEKIYIPIPIPKYNNPFDNQPTTGTPSQSDPSIKPNTTPKNELDNVSDTITKDPTQTDNPNTGGGDTPSIIIPTQSASSLWAIYNPTLGQLNSLGSWLWSTNFIDQILKIFNDPMQAIIGLHKVYATPSISGSGNIKVGYLDSGVPSNIVGNQYTYIDCGTVSLREYYGNILDYSPYTTVQLYLPFIGIVSLDIADVSRSSITVKYGVDVLTGACLASVSVQRDNAGGVLYQYSGNCACQYPLSSGSYMGMVTGAIGALGSLARGNIFGTAMGIAGMHTNIEHSGGFSGNAGAMGIKKPYLIISRPQSAMNDGFPSIQGYPSNYFTRLGNCNGFTQVAECHVENISATDKELDKIKDLLKEGVIL